jgi:hypothetical protein
MESAMIRPILAAGSIAFVLAASPAMGQQSPSPEPPAAQPEPPAAQPEPPAAKQIDPSIVGQAVYSSDGQKVGEVVEVGMAGGTQAVRVEMGEFLGMGSSSVIINANALERKADRVEVAMTAAEIRETISKQQKKEQ